MQSRAEIARDVIEVFDGNMCGNFEQLCRYFGYKRTAMGEFIKLYRLPHIMGNGSKKLYSARVVAELVYKLQQPADT